MSDPMKTVARTDFIEFKTLDAIHSNASQH